MARCAARRAELIGSFVLGYTNVLVMQANTAVPGLPGFLLVRCRPVHTCAARVTVVLGCVSPAPSLAVRRPQ